MFRKKKKEARPIYTLRVDLVLPKMTFSGSEPINTNSMNALTAVAEAITYDRQNLTGLRVINKDKEYRKPNPEERIIDMEFGMGFKEKMHKYPFYTANLRLNKENILKIREFQRDSLHPSYSEGIELKLCKPNTREQIGKSFELSKNAICFYVQDPTKNQKTNKTGSGMWIHFAAYVYDKLLSKKDLELAKKEKVPKEQFIIKRFGIAEGELGNLWRLTNSGKAFLNTPKSNS